MHKEDLILTAFTISHSLDSVEMYVVSRNNSPYARKVSNCTYTLVLYGLQLFISISNKNYTPIAQTDTLKRIAIKKGTQ